ncbi:MAG: winged helix-turn-helix transcriptional regulator, partial [Desulfonatronovibrionaceae bacterium]
MLETLRLDSRINQSELGRRVGLSGAMVNSYIKQLQKEGLLRLEPVNGKSYAYLLTPKGEEARTEMFGEYGSEVIRIYASLKQKIRDGLERLKDSGAKRIVLFGASEICEAALFALQETTLCIIAVVDNDPGKQDQVIQGIVVSPPEIMCTIRFDAVLITSLAQHQAVKNQLASLLEKKKIKV